ncbi:putative protein kinase RLK-Pelle-RLCK-VIIa-2 family [Helianthus annuus]|nr:putative protein kinase RLK-Pelle-RLCK-VIIa-2 family [Helianthus annuus]
MYHDKHRLPVILPPPPPLPPPKEKSEASSAGKIHILAHNNLNMFCLNYLKKATSNFKHNMRSMIGGGEFGEVFEGEFVIRHYSSYQICEDRRRVAIKKFRHYKIRKCMNANGIIKVVDMAFLREFNHPNIVKVLGYCFEDETLYLIYEFMANGSLDSHLFTKDKIPLPWKARVKIAMGIADALLHLHTTQNQVDDFSIKIHQILLDKDFNAKISDFESAILVYGGSFNKIKHCRKFLLCRLS